jgi:sarcosine oxidase subunit alpha
MRIEHDVARGERIALTVDGYAVHAYEGETLATALLAADITAFRVDGRGMPRGPFCNMGTCCECFVAVVGPHITRRVRACLTPVAQGMDVRLGTSA